MHQFLSVIAEGCSRADGQSKLGHEVQVLAAESLASVHYCGRVLGATGQAPTASNMGHYQKPGGPWDTHGSCQKGVRKVETGEEIEHKVIFWAKQGVCSDLSTPAALGTIKKGLLKGLAFPKHKGRYAIEEQL